MDQRNSNCGESTGPVPVDNPWDAFADDQLGVMDFTSAFANSYMDRQEASFIVMSFEQRHLVMAMRRDRRVVDIQRAGLGRALVACTPQFHHGPRNHRSATSAASHSVHRIFASEPDGARNPCGQV
jgi:hypothetical protein